MGPIIILDKSALHALSGAELEMLRWYFKENLTPILAAEVLGDLAKAFRKGKTGEGEVARLARKFGGSGPALCVDYEKAIRGELEGTPIPMTGQIPVDYATPRRDAQGRTGMIIDLHPVNHAIMRWRSEEFSVGERQASEYWRNNRKKLGTQTIERRLNANYVILPRVDALNDVVGGADRLLNDDALAGVWIEWLVEEMEMSTHRADGVRRRWEARGRPRLADYAPFAHHCLRTQLCYFLAVRARLLGDRATNMLDVRYLYYLPFCMVFCSGDVAHGTLAPLLMRPDQSYISRERLKDALRVLVTRRETDPFRWHEGTVDSQSLAGRDDLPVIAALWRKHCRYVPSELVPVHARPADGEPPTSTSPPSTPSSPRSGTPPPPSPAPAASGTGPLPATASTSPSAPLDPPLPPAEPPEKPTASSPSRPAE